MMKKLLLILLYLPMIGFGQQTYVPDDNFEAYLEANSMGNGIANDDFVTTANINSITGLNIANQSISDLTGIEGFSNLSWMDCSGNLLITLDLSQNDSINYFNFSNNLFLECINLQNGNNCNIGDLDTNGNPSLICIAIDTYPYNGCPQFNSPPIALLMSTCSNVSCGLPSAIAEHSTNKELLKVTDLLGRETKQTNQPLFYIYDDGTVEKRIVIE
jgi:hypothetical protein